MNKAKKILMVSAYFPPEPMPSEVLQYQLLDAFVEAGFKVDVVCPIPSRAISDEVRAAYRHNKQESLKNEQVTIKRFYFWREGTNPLMRALRYFLLNVVQYFKAIKVKDADVIFCASSPPTQGALCALIKRRLKIPLVYTLQDIFPDSMVSAGMTRDGSLVWKLGRKLEDYSYKHCDQIIVISKQGKQNLRMKGVPEDKLAVIYNWANTEQIVPVPREENKLFDDLGLDRAKIYVTYAGNLGPIQNVGLLLDAAELLKDQQDIRFVIFGAGAEWELLSQRAQGLPNVRLFPLMPKERLSEVYSLGDLSLVIAKKGLGAASMPSKTWSILAAGTPVLLSFDEGSELWELVEEEQLGICAQADDAQKMAERIVQVFEGQRGRESMAKKARAFAEGEVSFEASAGKYIQTVQKALQRDYSDTNQGKRFSR